MPSAAGLWFVCRDTSGPGQLARWQGSCE